MRRPLGSLRLTFKSQPSHRGRRQTTYLRRCRPSGHSIQFHRLARWSHPMRLRSGMSREPLGSPRRMWRSRKFSRRLSPLRAWHRRRSGWGDDLRWRMPLPCGCGSVGGRAVVGAVCGAEGGLAITLAMYARYLGRIVGLPLGQYIGCDLAHVGVHGQVKLAPCQAQPALLLGIPLALTEHSRPVLSNIRSTGPLLTRTPAAALQRLSRSGSICFGPAWTTPAGPACHG